MSSISATALGQIIEKDKAERQEEAADNECIHKQRLRS